MIDQDRDARLREAIELLYFGYRGFTAKPDQILRRRGLNRAHHRILYFVGRTPGLRVNVLLETLGITKQALNQPLRRLIDLKLVAVRPSPADRRVREVRLTAEGQKLEAQLTGAQARFLAECFERAGTGPESGWWTTMRQMARQKP